MTSLVAISSYKPPGIPLEDVQESLGISDTELRRYKRAFGYGQVASDEVVGDAQILVEAAQGLEGFGQFKDRISVVVRARTVRNSAMWPENPLAEACASLGLSPRHMLTVTDQACAGGMMAIELAGELLMDEAPDALALVFTGEKTFSPASRLIPGIALLGEAASAIVVSATGDRNKVLGYASLSVSIEGSGLTMNEKAFTEFGELYGPSLKTVMAQALDAAETSPEQLTNYIPSNVSKMLAIRTGRGLGIADERIETSTIPQIAHCFSADNFINLKTAIETGHVIPGDRCLMTSTGLGATFAAMVVEH